MGFPLFFSVQVIQTGMLPIIQSRSQADWRVLTGFYNEETDRCHRGPSWLGCGCMVSAARYVNLVAPDYRSQQRPG
jgi:hypothetical protein